MHTRFILSVTLCAAVFAAPAARAVDYPENIPENVRLVQKTTVNARTFTKIQPAIDDCVAKLGTKLKSTNRCVIRVAPGTWSGALTMRSFVDVEGSGDDTIITSAAPLGVAIYGPGPFAAATVKMAADSELRNLKVRNTSPTGGIAVLFDNVAGRLSSVTAEASNACAADSGATCDSAAVMAQGSSASASLAGVRARVTNTNAVNPKGDNVAIGSVRGGKVQVLDSSAVASGGSDEKAFMCMDDGAGNPANGVLALNDVTGEIVRSGRVLWSGDATCAVTVRNAVLRVTGCSPDAPAAVAASVSGPATFTGSELVDCACGFEGEGMRISASLVDQSAGTCTYGAARIVGCWDQEFEAIVYPPPGP